MWHRRSTRRKLNAGAVQANGPVAGPATPCFDGSRAGRASRRSRGAVERDSDGSDVPRLHAHGYEIRYQMYRQRKCTIPVSGNQLAHEDWLERAILSDTSSTNAHVWEERGHVTDEELHSE